MINIPPGGIAQALVPSSSKRRVRPERAQQGSTPALGSGQGSHRRQFGDRHSPQADWWASHDGRPFSHQVLRSVPITFAEPLKPEGRRPNPARKNMAHNISYEKENTRYSRLQAEIMCEATTLCKLEPLPTCPVPWFREPEHHRDRASRATRFAGQSQVGVWPTVRRMNRCPFWRRSGPGAFVGGGEPLIG